MTQIITIPVNDTADRWSLGRITHTLRLRGKTLARYGLGCVRQGEEGRQVDGGPLVPGPWAYAYALCNVLDNAGGSGRESADALADGTEHWIDYADQLVIDGLTYAIAPDRNDNIKLVPVPPAKSAAKTLTQTLRITPAQYRILCHRLEVSDAIAEAIEADDNLVHDICRCLLADDLQGSLALSEDVTKRVLEDAVTGSVVWPIAEDDASYHRHGQLRLANITRAGRALACRVGRYLGVEIEWPEY